MSFSFHKETAAFKIVLQVQQKVPVDKYIQKEQLGKFAP